MTTDAKLQKYHKALAGYWTSVNAGRPPIHKPTMEDFGIKSGFERLLANKVREQLEGKHENT